MALEFKCQNCGRDIIVKYLEAGEVAECKHCYAENIVPGKEQPETAEREVFSLRGRIGRQTFWLTVICLVIVNVLVAAIGKNSMAGLFVTLLWLPFAVWLSIALQVKRWHDLNRSGWMVLINLIPIVGSIWALIELGFFRGTVGPNRYGEDATGTQKRQESS